MCVNGACHSGYPSAGRVTPPSVHQMVLQLERLGLIRRTAGAARSIELLVAPNSSAPTSAALALCAPKPRNERPAGRTRAGHRLISPDEAGHCRVAPRAGGANGSAREGLCASRPSGLFEHAIHRSGRNAWRDRRPVVRSMTSNSPSTRQRRPSMNTTQVSAASLLDTEGAMFRDHCEVRAIMSSRRARCACLSNTTDFAWHRGDSVRTTPAVAARTLNSLLDSRSVNRDRAPMVPSNAHGVPQTSGERQ